MDIVDLISNNIQVRLGSSTADQFKDTWEGGNFTEQNAEALKSIIPNLRRFIKCPIIVHEVKQEILEYKTELESYLSASNNY